MIAEQPATSTTSASTSSCSPSFSTANYPIIAGGEAEIASGGSFSEVVDYATANDVELVAIDVEGRTAIDSLIMKPGEATTLEDVKGKTIGVKGKIPASVAAMLAGAGLVEGTDYQTVLLDGFDPIAHYHLDGIAGFPGYKSNEPGQLERAGLPYDLFDPTKYDVPGSFGDPVRHQGVGRRPPDGARGLPAGDDEGPRRRPRRSRRGHARRRSTSSRPTATRASCRWRARRTAGTPTPRLLQDRDARPATGIGVPDVAALQAELDAYAEVGLFGGTAPDAADVRRSPTPSPSVYDGDRGHLARRLTHPSVSMRVGTRTKHSDAPKHSDGVRRKSGGGAGIIVGVIEHLRAAWDEMTAPGAPFAMSTIDVRGIPTRVFDSGPADDAGDLGRRRRSSATATYVVYEDEHYTYAEIGAQVRSLAHHLRDVHGVGSRRPRRARPCATTPSGSSATGRSRRSAPPSSGSTRGGRRRRWSTACTTPARRC